MRWFWLTAEERRVRHMSVLRDLRRLEDMCRETVRAQNSMQGRDFYMSTAASSLEYGASLELRKHVNGQYPSLIVIKTTLTEKGMLDAFAAISPFMPEVKEKK